MRGKTKSKQKCECGATSYKDTGRNLACVCCGRAPTAYYVDVYLSRKENRGEAKRQKFYSHPATGDPFTDHNQCLQFLDHLRYEMTHNLFDPNIYFPKHLEVRRFENYAETFMSRFEVLVSRIDRTESTMSNYRGSLKNYLLPFFRDMDITQIRTHHIMTFYHEVLNKTNLRAKTQANHMAFLSRLLTAAWEEFDVQTKLPKFPRIDVPDDNDWRLIDARTQDLVISTVENYTVRGPR